MKVNSYVSINEVNQKEWDSIVDENNILNSYSYLKSIEYSKINNFKYNYFMFYGDCEKLIAHVQVGILTFGLDVMVGPTTKKVLNFIKNFFPSFLQMKFIESGFSSALGNSLLIIDHNYREEILEKYDRELIKLAKKEKTTFILIRDIYTSEKDRYDSLLKLKYKVFHNLPNTFIEISYKDFNEYLDYLVSKRRREIKHKQKVFHEAGCTVTKLYDFASISDKIMNLWEETFLQSKEYQREILNKDYFKYLSSFLNKKSFILLCEKDEKIIGFTMLIDSGDTLISTYCGLDYESNKENYTYFVLFYKSIEEAIKMKKKRLELGITNYNPKIEIGGVPEPMYVYGKSINPVINMFFVPMLSLINVSPKYNKRNIFNKRYYLKCNTKNPFSVFIRNKSYLIRDISLRELIVEGDNIKKRNNNVLIKIMYDNHIDIIAKTSIKYSEEINKTKCRIGLRISKISSDYLIKWNNLIQTYSY